LEQLIFKKGDVMKKGDIFILGLLIVAIISWFVMDNFLSGSGNKQVVIQVNGEHYQTLTLENDQRFKITYPENKYIEIAIKNKNVWVVDETVDCPRKICVKTGKISKAGQSIVCLPNKAVIYIKEEQVSNVDEVVF
jgi:hypothetical protein